MQKIFCIARFVASTPTPGCRSSTWRTFRLSVRRHLPPVLAHVDHAEHRARAGYGTNDRPRSRGIHHAPTPLEETVVGGAPSPGVRTHSDHVAPNGRSLFVPRGGSGRFELRIGRSDAGPLYGLRHRTRTTAWVAPIGRGVSGAAGKRPSTAGRPSTGDGTLRHRMRPASSAR